MRLQPTDLRRRLYIIFKGEEGLDYGGVARYVPNACLKYTCAKYWYGTMPVLKSSLEMQKCDPNRRQPNYSNQSIHVMFPGD